MQKIRKNQWAVSKIFKDGLTDGQTDKRTDKGDYHGPHRVNLGSKIKRRIFLETLQKQLKNKQTHSAMNCSNTIQNGLIMSFGALLGDQIFDKVEWASIYSIEADLTPHEQQL